MIYFHTETYQSTNNKYWFQWVDTYTTHKENNSNYNVTSYVIVQYIKICQRTLVARKSLIIITPNEATGYMV